MKSSLTAFALLLCTGALCAQQQTTANVKETETEYTYSFRVVLESGSSQDLLRCMNEVTTNNINIKMKGDLTTRIDEHSELHIVTHDRTLTIEHSNNDPVERERTKAVVERTKQCLNLPVTPDGGRKI